MKIAVFHNLSGGGSVKVLSSHVQHLRKRGHHVDIFSICSKNTGWFDKIFKEKQNEIIVFPPKNLFLQILWIIFALPKYHRELAVKLTDENYEFLYVHHDKFTKSPYLLKFTTIPTIYFLHEPPREFYEPIHFFCEKPLHYLANLIRFPIKYIDQINTSAASLIVSNSKYSQSVISNVYKAKSVVVYPPVEKNKHNINNAKKKQLLFVGGLNKLKDPLFAVDVFKKMSSEYNLIIIGDGSDSYTNLVNQSIGDRNIKVITKHLTNKEIQKYYSESIIVLAPFFNEPFGLVSIEAQSFGCIPVVSDTGGLKETVLNGHTGFIVKKNIDNYISAIHKAISNSVHMQNEMPVWLEKFSFNKSFSIIDRYENLLSKRRIS